MIECTQGLRRKKAARLVLGGLFSAFSAVLTFAPAGASAQPAPADLKIEKVADGLGFPEGPVWHPDGFLLFSDIHNAVILRLLPEGGSTPWFSKGKRTNGLVYNKDRSALYACCNSEKELLAINPQNREFRVLAKDPGGRPFNDVNDAVVDRHGNIYFTDPKWGGGPRNVEGVYRYSPDGKLSLAAAIDRQPNGIGLSPDGKWLYVARCGADEIWRFPVGDDGSLSSGTQWVKLPPKAGPDGMAVDRNGFIYQSHAGDGHVSVISPEGKIVRQIKVMDRMATNCELAGPDEKTLYVTGGGGREGTKTGAVYRVTLP